MFNVKDIIRAAQEQGWRVEEYDRGWKFLPPDTRFSMVVWHKTPSDQRAYRNFLSEMRRRGFKWSGQS